MYNLGQKVEDKFTKLSKIGFSTECFTADFLQFFTKKRQNLAFGLTAGYSSSNPEISGIFLKFPNFLISLFFLCGYESLPSGQNAVGISFLVIQG